MTEHSDWSRLMPEPWDGYWLAKIFGDTYLLELLPNDFVLRNGCRLPDFRVINGGQRWVGNFAPGLNLSERANLTHELVNAVHFNTDVEWSGPIEIPDGLDAEIAPGGSGDLP